VPECRDEDRSAVIAANDPNIDHDWIPEGAFSDATPRANDLLRVGERGRLEIALRQAWRGRFICAPQKSDDFRAVRAETHGLKEAFRMSVKFRCQAKSSY